MSSLNLPISISDSWFYIVVMNFSDAVRICNPLYSMEPKPQPSMSVVPRELQDKMVKFQVTLQTEHREKSSTLRDWWDITWYSREKEELTKRDSDPVLYFPIEIPWLHVQGKVWLKEDSITN